MADINEIKNRFKYHPATTHDRQQEHEAVREALGGLAVEFSTTLPEGREKALALTHLEEAMFWANAAIARQP